MGQGCQAADGVAAHAGPGSVAIVDIHAEVGTAAVTVCQQDQTVGPGPEISVAQTDRDLLWVRGGLLPGINHDEVVAETFPLTEMGKTQRVTEFFFSAFSLKASRKKLSLVSRVGLTVVTECL